MCFDDHRNLNPFLRFVATEKKSKKRAAPIPMPCPSLLTAHDILCPCSCNSVVEYRPFKSRVVGSSPTTGIIPHTPIAFYWPLERAPINPPSFIEMGLNRLRKGREIRVKHHLFGVRIPDASSEMEKAIPVERLYEGIYAANCPQDTLLKGTYSTTELREHGDSIAWKVKRWRRHEGIWCFEIRIVVEHTR